MSLFDHTAAEVAAAALFELFPGIELAGAKKTSVGFAYDFYCAQPLPAEAEVLVEERMRQIARENRPIRVLEMVPFSARELLLKEGHPVLADRLEGEEGLVEIIQIGSFHALSPGPHLTHSSKIGAFKLWPFQFVEEDGDRKIRLSGCSFSNKAELKEFLKKYRAYSEISHMRMGERKNLWKILGGQVVWLADGLGWQRDVLTTLREALFQNSLEVAFPDRETAKIYSGSLSKEMGRSLAEIYTEANKPWDSEAGLFTGEGGVQIRVSYFGSLEELKGRLISSLQTIEKSLNILGFQYCLRLFGRRQSDRGVLAMKEALDGQGAKAELELGVQHAARLDFLVEDNLTRRWAAFSVFCSTQGFFVTASIERIVALLLERSCCENKKNGELH